MKESTFTKEELEHYSRQIIIPGLNIAGQQKLKAAKVLVVGAGGLGAPLLQYLTAGGVGTIGIVDFDVVEESNLHRQVIFTQQDIGKLKVEVAGDRLKEMNRWIHFVLHPVKLTSENALKIISDYDIVADGTDNFQTRYLVNDACVLLGKTNVYASIFRFDGQLSVFNFKDNKGEFGPNYRDLFPLPPPPGEVPNCAEAGVLGVLPGIIGSLQANEVIKIITGIGEILSGKLFSFDALSMESRIFKIRKDPSNPLNGTKPTQKSLIDYDEFCGVKPSDKRNFHPAQTITVHELKSMMDKQEEFQLIDVREPYEFEIANIGGKLIPKGEIRNHIDEIDKNKKVVIYCRSGKRSEDVIRMLKEEFGFHNLWNLEGGMLKWAEEVDKGVARY